MDIVAIVQSRMGSTRLPGKVMKTIKGRYILSYVVDRLKMCKNLDNIIVATTTNKEDDIIEEYCIWNNVDCYRGSNHDVLSRFYHTAKKYDVDIVVRVTSDCPLIDPCIVDDIINVHISEGFDYTGNFIPSFPKGLDVEVFDFDVLETVFNDAKKDYEREHVTPYIHSHPGLFRLRNVKACGKLFRPDIRITLDTVEDFKVIKYVVEGFDSLCFSSEEVVDYLYK